MALLYDQETVLETIAGKVASKRRQLGIRLWLTCPHRSQESSTTLVQKRLAQLENQLQLLTSTMTAPLHERLPDQDQDTPAVSRSNHADQQRDRAQVWSEFQVNATEGDASLIAKHPTGLTFESRRLRVRRYVGETSTSHVLQSVEDELHEWSELHDGSTTFDASTPTVPDHPSVIHTEVPHQVLEGRIRHALRSQRITPQSEPWNNYVEIFMSDVHPLYPFLDLAVIRGTKDKFWKLTEYQGNLGTLHNDEFVQYFLILAIGKCAYSSRTNGNEGLHSAGWSLYCAALALQGDLLDFLGDDSRPLQTVQTVTLMV